MKLVDEGIPYGVYIWAINGKPIVDEDFNYLQIASKRGDIRKISALQEFVNKELNIYEGKAVFMEGVRPISHEEWENQKARELSGQVPDEYDLGNLIDEYNYRKEVDAT